MAHKIRKQNRHFVRRIASRFYMKYRQASKVRDDVISLLILNQLPILFEDKEIVKVWYPQLHKQCVLIFDKINKILITGYKVKNFENRYRRTL